MATITSDIAAADTLTTSQAAIRAMQRMLNEGTAVVAQNTSGAGITTPAIVKLVNRATVDDHVLPTIAKAIITDFDDLIGVLTMDEVGASSVANNALGFVTTSGHIKINNSFGVGDMLWVDPATSGNFTATAQAGYPPVGKCLVTGASGLILFNRQGLLREAQYVETTTDRIGGLATSDDRYIFVGPFASCRINQVTIVSDTATTGSNGTNNWTFQVRNLTASLNLLSTAKTTNGAEIPADAVYDLTPNQNQTIAANDVIELQIVKNAVPTDLTTAEISVIVEYQPI